MKKLFTDAPLSTCFKWKRSRDRSFRGTIRLFSIKRHAISSWKCIQSIAKVSRKEILNVKFYYFFFPLRISWIWLFRENGRFLSSRNLFLTRNFTFEYLLTLLRLGVEKKEIHSYSLCVYIYIRVYEDDEVWRNDSFSTTKNESWEMYVWNLNIEFNLFFSILLSFQVIKHRRGDFLPVNQFLILKSLELHERIKNCIKNVIKYYEY